MAKKSALKRRIRELEDNVQYLVARLGDVERDLKRYEESEAYVPSRDYGYRPGVPQVYCKADCFGY